MDKLWELPVPSSALREGGRPALEKRSGREVALRISYETDEMHLQTVLVFEGVLKVTYDGARGSEMLEAYDCLDERPGSLWRSEVLENLSSRGANTDGLRHVRINFDDGPCYETVWA